MNEISEAPRTQIDCVFYKPKKGVPPDTPFVLDTWGVPMFHDYAFERVMKNTVMTAGKNDMLDKYWAAAAYTAAWFAGLISSVSYSAISAADLPTSHAGWTEAGTTNAPTFTGTRPQITFAAAAGGVKASSAIPTITFTGAGTVKGLFTATNSAVMNTTGVMYSAGLFTAGDAVVGVGYVMTMTFSATQT